MDGFEDFDDFDVFFFNLNGIFLMSLNDFCIFWQRMVGSLHILHLDKVYRQPLSGIVSGIKLIIWCKWYDHGLCSSRVAETKH